MSGMDEKLREVLDALNEIVDDPSVPFEDRLAARRGAHLTESLLAEPVVSAGSSLPKETPK